MGAQTQIVKRKKKGRGRGRPSKADLALRAAAEARELRRKLRRRRSTRSVDHEDDDDDYSVSLSSSEYDEEEEDKRREKKLKLVLKLPSNGDKTRACGGRRRIAATAGHAPPTEYAAAYSSSSSPENKLPKKRKVGGYDCDYGGDENDGNVNSDCELRGQKGDRKRIESVPGTPADPASGSGVPLPNKKSLELILDKLQKKDTYCVFAEPVDPEELPDYHDIIDHPMDFATVRKKLANGSYSTLEQLESDVFLICSNAMQYNSPETIYHKQARSIQELARKKFERLRIEFEHSEKELKLEEKTSSSLIAKKAISSSAQEPIGSDFDSGTTLATAGDIQSDLNINQAICEKPNIIDGVVEVNSTLVDTNFDKAEELSSGKSLPSKFGRKPFLLDENRRATYHISNQTAHSSEPIVSIFEGENKQLVAVGLHAEYSYARSLARFAATLGPVAWKVASKRIEQVVPAGFKFGRGWVGEYEPLPTAVLMLETYSPRVPLTATGSLSAANLIKEDRMFKAPFPAKDDALKRVKLEGRLPFAGSIGHSSIQQNSAFRNVVEPKDNVSPCAKLDPIHLASRNRNDLVAGKKQCSSDLEMSPSRPIEADSRSRNLLQSGSPLKRTSTNTSGIFDGTMANGKVMINASENSREINLSSDSVANPKAGTYFPNGQHLVYGEPVRVMTMLTQKDQKQQKPSNHLPADMALVPPSAPLLRRDDHQNGSTATVGTVAPTWISMGAGGGYRPKVETPSTTDRNQISADSLYNPTREFYSQNTLPRGGFPVSGGMHFQSPKNGFPFQAFAPQSIKMSNEAQFQNRPLHFSQLGSTDLSRLQLPVGGFNPRNNQLRQKEDTLPPDLNIRFQPLGSPVKQTQGVSGILVESQQPDLALQL